MAQPLEHPGLILAKRIDAHLKRQELALASAALYEDLDAGRVPWELIAAEAVKAGLTHAADYLCEHLSSPPKEIDGANPLVYVATGRFRNCQTGIVLANSLNSAGIVLSPKVLAEIPDPTPHNNMVREFLQQRWEIIRDWPQYQRVA